MSSDATPRLGLPDMPETPELYPDIVADAFMRLDAFTDLCLKGQYVNTPPSSPADGDAYLTGGSPAGAWSGYPYKIAACRDGAWTMLTPFNGLRAWVAGTNAFIVYCDGVWTDWTSLIGAGESSIASAATCDIGAAGSLFVSVTGTATITSFGGSANRLRFLRFAGALTLTHNAASLVLPGAANIATAAGDPAICASDGSGNWRCRGYTRADGRMVNLASPAFTGTITANIANFAGALSCGASTDTVPLSVNGQNGPNYVPFKNAGIVYGYIGNGAGLVSGGSKDNLVVDSVGALQFVVNNDGVVRAMVAANGSFLVGTQAAGGWDGNARAAVQASNGKALSVYQSAASGADSLNIRVDATGVNLAAFVYGNGGSPVGVGSITTNGSATAYNTTSDARLKTVSPRQADYRNAIRALWVGDFTWTQSGAPGFGVLAQQAWEVMPNRQGVRRPAAEDGVWEASAEPFAHLALWGVKDLYALIEALAARVATLEARHAG